MLLVDYLVKWGFEACAVGPQIIFGFLVFWFLDFGFLIVSYPGLSSAVPIPGQASSPGSSEIFQSCGFQLGGPMW